LRAETAREKIMMPKVIIVIALGTPLIFFNRMDSSDKGYIYVSVFWAKERIPFSAVAGRTDPRITAKKFLEIMG